MASLKKVNLELFNRLKFIKENHRYEVFAGSDPLDINIVDTTTNTPLYENPINDTADKLDEFSRYIRYPFLCFYGIGNGFFFNALLKYNFKHIVIVEPEIELIYIALHFSDLSKDIESLRLMIFHSDDFSKFYALKIAALPDIGVYIKLYNLHFTSIYYGDREDDIVRVNRFFVDGMLQFVKNHGNDSIDSLIGIEHFILNIKEMVEGFTFLDFIKKRNTNLAICVATGPSLTKQLPLLKEIQDSVTIFSVDASLPILEKWGIKPDVVTSLERIELTSEFFKKTPKEFHKDIIFIHSALQHKTVIDSSFGEKVIVMRPFGYMQVFGLNEFGYAGIGMSAANLSFELAFFMRFSNIVLIGQDLAYGSDGTTHAQDHSFGANDKNFIENIKNEEKPLVTKYGGDGLIQTNAIWQMFLNYFIQNIAEAKNNGVNTINATEGGARIEGSIEKSLQDVVAQYVDLSHKKSKISLEKRKNKDIQRDLKKAKAVLAEVIKAGERKQKDVEELFLEVATICGEMEELNSKSQLENLDFDKLNLIIKKIDKIKRIFEDDRFRMMYWESLRSLIVHQELEIAKIVVKPAHSELEKKARDIEFVFAHKPWLYILAGGISSQLEVVKRAKNSSKLC